jgi:cbb3-type cytochrome oxidase subunit 1
MTISIRFLLAAAFYGLISMVMGMVMGAKEDFTLTPVHAHLNLLGWIALTLYGIVYKIYPAMGESKLATTQFYAANVGILVLIPSLAAFLLGNANALPIMIAGELLTVSALVIFFVNIWNHRNQ